MSSEANSVVTAEIIIVGGGLAGLSAAVYLRRALRDTLLIDEQKSMARWEPDVQNYLGFPDGMSGELLLRRGRQQAARYGARVQRDRIVNARVTRMGFSLRGRKQSYSCDRLLLATGIFHIPPDIPGIKPCLGHSLFFCKDCDGYRVRGKDVAVYGWSSEAVEYALSMLVYSSCVFILTDGRVPRWGRKHAAWLREYQIPVYRQKIIGIKRDNERLRALRLEDGRLVVVEALFTTRGDIYFNKLAKGLGAKVDREGQIVVGLDMDTTVKGLYAAGCVTPSNCQMIIAAGEGAIAAQAINRDLFSQSLNLHSLRRFRSRQMRHEQTNPVLLPSAAD